MQIATTKALILEKILGSETGSTSALESSIAKIGGLSRRQMVRIIGELFAFDPIRNLSQVTNADALPLVPPVATALQDKLARAHAKVLIARLVLISSSELLVCNDRRGERWWVKVHHESGVRQLDIALERLRDLVGGSYWLVPDGSLQGELRQVNAPSGVTIVDWVHAPLSYRADKGVFERNHQSPHEHISMLEAESIQIIREAVSVSKRPAMLFSMGKDSMVMWTLAKKAFWPEPPPFPLVIIDTGWKFQDMYRFRQTFEDAPDIRVIVHINQVGVREGINPFDHGSAVHTDVMKTKALRQILDAHQFDFVFGGARRDEEKSRSKERIFSLRSQHAWDPKNQRPELWTLFNTRLMPNQSMRVFPLSNWTELDIWRYIEREHIDLVPLYFSKIRPFVERNGSLIMVDDNRFRLGEGERIRFEPIRFRTLGCYPLTGGMLSPATTVQQIIEELETTRISERSSRVIDFDAGASMEQKKKEGYF